LSGKRGKIARTDFATGSVIAGADVNVHRIDVSHLVTFAPLEQMNGLKANHAGDTLFAHHHGLPQQHPPVETANGLEFQAAVVFDFGNHEADFIHMGCNHHSQSGGRALASGRGRALAPTFAGNKQVAHRVYPPFVGMQFGRFDNDFSNVTFSAGHPKGIGKLFEIHN
jgi:hypothetical protein